MTSDSGRGEEVSRKAGSCSHPLPFRVLGVAIHAERGAKVSVDAGGRVLKTLKVFAFELSSIL